MKSLLPATLLLTATLAQAQLLDFLDERTLGHGAPTIFENGNIPHPAEPQCPLQGPCRQCAAMALKDDLPFVDDYLPALLGQASHLIQSEFHRVVKAKGLSVAEWRVLASLVR